MNPGPLRSAFSDQPEMVELIRKFVSGLPTRIAHLRAAVGNPSEAAAAQRLAHQLKGAAGGYGFPEISEAAGRLEEAFLRSRPTDVAAALEDLGSLCRRASPEGDRER